MTTEALVLQDAEALLPLIVEEFGDTELLQARRRAVLEAEIVRRDPRRKAAA